MCALVQAIRKLGIVAGGPGLGDPSNPMHIVRKTSDSPAPAAASSNSDGSRPGTSGSEFDSSFGQRRRMAEDPSTHIDDDRRPALPQQQIFEYYAEDDLDRQLSGTTAARASGSEELEGRERGDMERGKSFGRRRRRVEIADLEKGPEPR